MAIETHPFEPFIPMQMKYLLLGSFTSKDAKTNSLYDWYYSNGRNQFWKLIEQVYGVDLPNKSSKIELFTRLNIGVTDIIYKCERTQDSSLDNVLEVVELQPALSRLIEYDLKAVYFSSRFVEDLFRKNFSRFITNYPQTKLVYLPSPSPRYAAMSKTEKIVQYRELLPKLG